MSERGILISDFDGTLSRQDFFRVALARLVPAGVPDYWKDYREGRLTHFEAMRAYYSAIRTSEADTLAAVEDLGIPDDLAHWVARLQSAGWTLVVASAGCSWYIRHLLDGQGVDVQVHANPGRFIPGQGLLLEMPHGSPYLSPTHGIDKEAIVRAARRTSPRVAFAGDGYPDLAAACAVEADLRFATGALAETLTAQGLPYRPFHRWTEVAEALVAT